MKKFGCNNVSRNGDPVKDSCVEELLKGQEIFLHTGGTS